MRTIFLTLILFLVNVFHIYGQSQEKIYLGQIVADSTTIEADNVISKMLDEHFSPILNSKNKIEIRIAKSNFPNFYAKFSFNNLWTFEKHTYDPKSNKFDTIKVNVQDRLEKLIENLVKNNIFSLPGGRIHSINKFYLDVDKNEVFGEGIGISHPNYYCLEFKVGEMYRKYYYYAPEKMYTFLQVTDVGQFINIFKLIDKVK